MVDDHDADDVTSVEEHDRRDNKESRSDWHEKVPSNHNGDANAESSAGTRNGVNNGAEGDGEREKSQPSRSACFRASGNVPASLGSGTTREIRVFKCNGVKTKKQMYTLPPEYLSHIVILGK